VARQVDHGHAAAVELVDDLVAVDSGPGRGGDRVLRGAGGDPGRRHVVFRRGRGRALVATEPFEVVRNHNGGSELAARPIEVAREPFQDRLAVGAALDVRLDVRPLDVGQLVGEEPLIRFDGRASGHGAGPSRALTSSWSILSTRPLTTKTVAT